MTMVLREKFTFLVTLMVLSHFGADALKLNDESSDYGVKTIQTEHGDIYDCMDFYKQPAFDHPLLKNHTFHPRMRPTSRPRRINNNSNKNSTINEIPIDLNMIRFKDGGCPPGTVPIRRMNQKDNHFQLQENLDGSILAVGQTKSSPWRKYYGVGATISIYNPKVQQGQYSSAEIVLKTASDAIIAGWTVSPNKYNDTQTRFFIYAIANGLHCFNSECGFIIVREDIPLDFVMSPVSTRGKTIYTNAFFVFQDAKNGNWWLEVGLDPIVVGFWPQKIFDGLKDSATYAACGGEVYSPAGTPLPEMGTGHYPDFFPDMVNDAFCKEFIVVDEGHKIVDADYTERYTDKKEYGVYDKYLGHLHVVTFGGYS